MGVVLSLSIVGALNAAFDDGMITIEVDSPKHRKVSIHMPGLFVKLGASAIPDEAFDDVGKEFEEWGPAALDVLDALAKEEDFEIVRLDSDEEIVRVEKSNGNLEIRVYGEGERIRIKIPLSVARNVIQRIERAGPDA